MTDELAECTGVQADPQCWTMLGGVVVVKAVTAMVNSKGVHYLGMLPAGQWPLVRLPGAECYLRNAAVQADPQCWTMLGGVVVVNAVTPTVNLKGGHYLGMLPAGQWPLLRLPSAECYLRNAADRLRHPDEL